MTSHELEELDHEIEECEGSLAILQGMLNDPEKRRHLERRLFELKRERRREALLSWRDLVWLRGEIRKLQRELDSLRRTGQSPENRETPK